MSPDHRFSRQDRLVRREDFDRVLARKCSVYGQWLILHGCENTVGRPRLGRVIGKRWGSAVHRNRFRRWIRDAFRLAKAELPKLDFVVMLMKNQGLGCQELAIELPQLAARLKEKLKVTRPS
jgi:ribonuclease P protein component